VDLSKSRTDYLPNPDGTLRPISSSAYESDDVTLDFPGAIGVGASWRPESRLTLSADYTRTFWSRAYVYDYFVIRVGDSGGPATRVPPPSQNVYAKLPYPYFTQAAQADAEQLRLGLEYVFISGRLKLPIRAGYFNDRQIRRDADGRASRYNGVTAGTGLIVGPVLLDAAYLYESGSYDDVSLGTVTQKTHQVLASVIYRFGAAP
jgi:long-subunit fatty acid transport protein